LMTLVSGVSSGPTQGTQHLVSILVHVGSSTPAALPLFLPLPPAGTAQAFPLG
jgi:hypothetical protein